MAEKQQKEALAATAATLPSKTKSKVTEGGHVWIRNENLTLRVGPLPRGWEKKIDSVRGMEEETDRRIYGGEGTEIFC